MNTAEESALLREFERDLHDLCQPVTSLHCRLELARLDGGEEALLEATDGALEDARKIFWVIGRMRERLIVEGSRATESVRR
jgi:hypothetical protein